MPPHITKQGKHYTNANAHYVTSYMCMCMRIATQRNSASRNAATKGAAFKMFSATS